MNNAIYLVANILPQNANDSPLTAFVARFLVSMGHTDFDWLIVGLICAVFVPMCVSNYLLLRSNRISKKQLTSSRRYGIHREGKTVSAFKFTPWLRVLSHLFCTAGLPVVMYCLASSEFTLTVAFSVLLAAGYLTHNTYLALREILHPRSTHNRRYLFFRSNPTFIKVRLLFGLFRRYIYIVFGFAVFAYSCHRLMPDVFLINNSQSLLFVTHLESAINGLTKFGSDHIVAHGNAATVFLMIRSTFGIAGILWVGNLLLTGLASPGSEPRTQRKATVSKAFSVAANTSHSPAETESALVETISFQLKIPEKDISLKSDLVNDLKANPVDLADIHLHLAQFSGKSFPHATFLAARTIQALVDLFADKDVPAPSPQVKPPEEKLKVS
jgi:acyl carrier protein